MCMLTTAVWIAIDNIVQVGIRNGDIISVGLIVLCTGNPHRGFGYGLRIIIALQNITFIQIFSHWGLS